MKKIDKKSRKVISSRGNLVVLFFVASGATFGFIASALSTLDSQTAGARIFVALCVFATAITIGWLRYRWLGKKLDALTRQKKSLIAQR